VVDRLTAGYRRIRDGLGFRKDPAAYGAFPTDCYSHTPAHAGAQQPGMTGQVKEEVLTRLGELGFVLADGPLTTGAAAARRRAVVDPDRAEGSTTSRVRHPGPGGGGDDRRGPDRARRWHGHGAPVTR
jgi:hypothetical protein